MSSLSSEMRVRSLLPPEVSVLFLVGGIAECAILCASAYFDQLAPPSNPHRGLFVVHHVHLPMWWMLQASALIALFYWLWTVLSHRTLSRKIGRIHFTITFFAFNIGYFAARSATKTLRITAEGTGLMRPSDASIRLYHLSEIAFALLVGTQLLIIYNIIEAHRRTDHTRT